VDAAARNVFQALRALEAAEMNLVSAGVGIGAPGDLTPAQQQAWREAWDGVATRFPSTLRSLRALDTKLQKLARAGYPGRG
jgi:hypothetical protein